MSENISSPQDLVQKWRKKIIATGGGGHPVELRPSDAHMQCADQLEAAYPAWEARIRLEAIMQCAKTICVNCDNDIGLSDGKNKMHLGGLYCYAWAIRALAADPSKEGATQRQP